MLVVPSVKLVKFVAEVTAVRVTKSGAPLATSVLMFVPTKITVVFATTNVLAFRSVVVVDADVHQVDKYSVESCV